MLRFATPALCRSLRAFGSSSATAAARPLAFAAFSSPYAVQTAGAKSFSKGLGTYQPEPAIDLIHEIPPTEVQAEKVACDGGGGALGHPKVWISIEHIGETKPCEYCGLRFVRVPGGSAH